MTRNPGTELTRFNALRHGVLSRHVPLPWEDAGEYADLIAALAAEHAPAGPTEEHLVEELAGILWRKRRLRMAEAAAHRRGLHQAAKPFRDTAAAAVAHLAVAPEEGAVRAALTGSGEASEAEVADLAADEAMTRAALALAAAGDYAAAVEALREDTRAWWTDTLAGDLDDADVVAPEPTAEALRRFLEAEVLPWYADRRRDVALRPLIREQALGESLDAAILDRLARYETHLDRKLERTLAMLIRLRDLRPLPEAD